MSDFFATQAIDEWGTSYSLTGAGYTALVLLMILFLLGACYFSKGRVERKLSTKTLAFCAMAVALAMLTSIIRLFKLPMGGSITLFSMLFICLIGYLYGVGTGIMAAIAYGFLQLIIDPYIVSLPQMLMDYIFAFGSLGLSGLFSKSKHGLEKGYLLGITARFLFSFLSGLIFFAYYAEGSGMSAPIYSMVYNGSYIYIEGILTLIILAMPPVKSAITRVKQLAIT